MGKQLYIILLLAVTCFGGNFSDIATAQEYPEFDLPEDYEHAPRESVSFSATNDTGTSDEGDDSDSDSYTQKYTVRKGDTLGSISKKFFGTIKSWKKIAKANKISDPSGLKVGRVITIPGNSPAKAYNSGRKKRRVISSPREYDLPLPPPLDDSYSSYDTTSVSLPPLPPLPGKQSGSDVVLYQDTNLPKLLLPIGGNKENTNRRCVTFEGLTGLTRTVAAYPLGKGKFSTAFGIIWNEISKREGNRLRNGEDGNYYQFPIALTYGGENFEVGMLLPFESYDVYAPITYNFRDGSDSGMGDAALRLKFSSQNDNMASAIGFGAIFPTSDRTIGNTTSDNAWEIFGAVSTKKKEGGNFHLNGGYQAGSGNTAHEGVFINVGFEYAANESFSFMGEIGTYNRINYGRSTDLTLSLRYFPKSGMAVTIAAPISLANDSFFGYDYRLQGQIQYHY
ncbi:MAG: LysM peptidoglycan-binding domain-containing protein [Candidatus Riflebacteria bacterium]|nr:LysM peptidoglycan-binding domain-containing protein [Candidatus Riflebacteria bacterium]